MNSGIITFHAANNYGAVLQAYALKCICEKIGQNCDIIDYSSKFIIEKYTLTLDYSSFKQLIKSAIRYCVLKRRYARFDLFREKYLSPVSYDEKKYQIIIVGSDQVWNYNLTLDDTGYLLDFVENGITKVSYAPSFGMMEIDVEHRETYKNLLNKFDYLSVREPEGKKIISDLIGRDSEIVLDPTLLLTKEQWIDALNIKKRKTGYIFCYLFGMTEATRQFIMELARREKLRIIGISDSVSLNNDGIKYDYTASPSEWVSYFYNATYVVTNTFHGTAFSIIFEKQFYIGEIVNLKGRGRIDNLLEKSGLSCRTNFSNTNIINYEIVGERMRPYIDSSLEYLKKILSEKNNV